APPWRECGLQATALTRAPRSSPPQAPPPRLPSRCTPTWSSTTYATPSATSTTTSPPDPPTTPARRSHDDQPRIHPWSRPDIPARNTGTAEQTPAGPHDLAGRLPDPHRAEPRPRRLARPADPDRSHVRAR